MKLPSLLGRFLAVPPSWEKAPPGTPPIEAAPPYEAPPPTYDQPPPSSQPAPPSSQPAPPSSQPSQPSRASVPEPMGVVWTGGVRKYSDNTEYILALAEWDAPRNSNVNPRASAQLSNGKGYSIGAGYGARTGQFQARFENAFTSDLTYCDLEVWHNDRSSYADSRRVSHRFTLERPTQNQLARPRLVMTRAGWLKNGQRVNSAHVTVTPGDEIKAYLEFSPPDASQGVAWASYLWADLTDGGRDKQVLSGHLSPGIATWESVKVPFDENVTGGSLKVSLTQGEASSGEYEFTFSNSGAYYGESVGLGLPIGRLPRLFGFPWEKK